MILSLCFLVGFPGNLAVIILKPKWQQLSRLTQGLMMNLAMSDLLCLVTLPLWIYFLLDNWTLGSVTCKILSYFVYCSIYSSLLTVAALSLQRYMQIVYQQKCLQFKKRLLVLLWLIAMALSISALIVRQPTKVKEWILCIPKYTSWEQRAAVLLSECFVGFGSFAVIAFSYICLNQKLKRAVFFNNARTPKLVTSIIVTFFVLWMPYHVLNLVGVVASLQNNQRLIQFVEDSLHIVESVTFINSCINPLLYAFASRNVCLCAKNKTSDDNEEPTLTNVAVE